MVGKPRVGFTRSPHVSVAVGRDRVGFTGSPRVSVAVGRPHAVVYGDLNGDGVVDAIDLSLALQIFVGMRQPTVAQLQAADVRPKPGTFGRPFGDGAIRADDLNWLFRRFLGLETAP